jgi:phenylacetate-CoA ligase
VRHRAAIIRHTLRAVRSQWWRSQTITAWQERALVRMMRHACTHVPFYRQLGIAPESITRAADLQRFPVLRKADLQSDPDAFLAKGFDRARLHSSRTSGSTGEPTVTWFDHDAWALCKYALKIRRIIAVASPFFRRCLIVSEQPPREADAYRHERPFGSGFLYSERVVSLFDDMDAHREAIRQFRPDMLYAFPSWLLELARCYRESGEPLPRIPWLFTSSEVLTPEVRHRIESAFRGRLFDIYGSTEFKEVAWQCRSGGYHVNFESVYVETCTEDPQDSHAPIVLSTLCNRAMPLLRFRTGDLGSLTTGPCACGRHSPQLHIAHGREGEMLHLPSGRRLSPYTLTTLIETLPGLHQYRIRHDAPAQITVELAGSEDLSAESLESCRRQLLGVLREPVSISMERVTQLARSAGGKHKVFVRRW